MLREATYFGKNLQQPGVELGISDAAVGFGDGQKLGSILLAPGLWHPAVFLHVTVQGAEGQMKLRRVVELGKVLKSPPKSAPVCHPVAQHTVMTNSGLSSDCFSDLKCNSLGIFTWLAMPPLWYLE